MQPIDQYLESRKRKKSEPSSPDVAELLIEPVSPQPAIPRKIAYQAFLAGGFVFGQPHRQIKIAPPIKVPRGHGKAFPHLYQPETLFGESVPLKPACAYDVADNHPNLSVLLSAAVGAHRVLGEGGATYASKVPAWKHSKTQEFPPFECHHLPRHLLRTDLDSDRPSVVLQGLYYLGESRFFGLGTELKPAGDAERDWLIRRMGERLFDKEMRNRQCDAIKPSARDKRVNELGRTAYGRHLSNYAFAGWSLTALMPRETNALLWMSLFLFATVSPKLPEEWKRSHLSLVRACMVTVRWAFLRTLLPEWGPEGYRPIRFAIMKPEELDLDRFSWDIHEERKHPLWVWDLWLKHMGHDLEDKRENKGRLIAQYEGLFRWLDEDQKDVRHKLRDVLYGLQKLDEVIDDEERRQEAEVGMLEVMCTLEPVEPPQLTELWEGEEPETTGSESSVPSPQQPPDIDVDAWLASLDEETPAQELLPVSM